MALLKTIIIRNGVRILLLVLFSSCLILLHSIQSTAMVGQAAPTSSTITTRASTASWSPSDCQTKVYLTVQRPQKLVLHSQLPALHYLVSEFRTDELHLLPVDLCRKCLSRNLPLHTKTPTPP